MTIRLFNRMMLLLSAPFTGMLAVILALDWSLPVPAFDTTPPPLAAPIDEPIVSRMSGLLDEARRDAETTGQLIRRFHELYERTSKTAAVMAQTAAAASGLPDVIFDNRIARVVGRPVRTVSGTNSDLKLYVFSTGTFNGYALRVRIKTSAAARMVLGQDRVPGAETTLSAALRYGATAGVNAGGFADDRAGRRYPLGATILDGRWITRIDPTADDLVFVGFNRSMRLVGTPYRSAADIDRLDPLFGASFAPVLLRDGRKEPIPAKWLTSPRRAPRTVVGRFRNDQLMFVVVDGYDERGSSGATLPELQDLLLQMRISDAYNLDGGGSSTLVFEGRIVNRPSDGRPRLLPTHFLFFR